MVRNLLLVAAFGGLIACDKQKENTPDTQEAPPEVVTEVEEPTEEPTSQAAPKAELPDDLPPGETKLYGSRFTIIEEPITLASAVEQSAENPGPYKIDATMEQVCAKKGCWFTLAGEGIDKPIRVKMKDYGFFVPRNANGARVIVEGTLSSREVPEEEAKHYAEDEGKSPEEVAKIGAMKVYEFTATSVEVTMPQG